jgi:hypothetical protein
MSRAMPALLAGLVDYAGLFPPAALEMPEAVARFAAYRTGPQRGMLGRFVVPAARLDEFAAAAAPHLGPGDPWQLSVLAGADDAERIARFNRDHGARTLIDTIEARATDVQTIWKLATAYDASSTVYVEIPVADDPSTLVAELAARELRAKIRTGGVTADAIPPAAHLLRFLATCARHGVPLKATAGLHHPLRGEYPLTYAADSARGTMYGFLNVFLAAALLYDGTDETEVAPLLEERDPAAFRVEGASISWRGHALTVDEIARARSDFAGSFGSCSFEEPVQDLAALQMLPAMLST